MRTVALDELTAWTKALGIVLQGPPGGTLSEVDFAEFAAPLIQSMLARGFY